MARNFFSHTTDAVVALVAATAKTVLQMTAGSARLALQAITVTFDGTSGSATPVVIQLMRQTVGSGAGTARNPLQKDSDIATALIVTGKKNFTVEPTYGAILHTWHVHPQAGAQIALPLPGEYIIPGTGLVGLVITAPANVNCLVTVEGEE